MSDFKPSRATIDIVGNVGRVDSKFDGQLTEATVAVSKGYKDKATQEWVDTGTDWYTLIARGDYAQTLLDLNPGDRVEATGGKLEHREYQKSDGSTGISYEINFAEVTVLERKGERQAASAGAPTSF